MRSCELAVAQTADGYLVRIEGHATLQYSPSFSAFAVQAFEASPPSSITVDLRSCQYLDSTFLGCLVRLHRRAAGAPPASLSVIVDDSGRRRLLAPTRLDAVLRLTDVAPEVLGSFVPIRRGQLSETQFGRHVAESHEALAELPCDHARLFRDIADRLARELQNRPSCI
jgi:anti-anti-sigma regulatory factor